MTFCEEVKEIRRFDKERISGLRDGMLAGHICRTLSPIFSAWFIRCNVRPNTVTVLMILFGVIGSVFFAIPNIWCKIIGYMFFFLWFTMDLSDGEVARISKRFSKYGTEMDYMAHLICHPCMNLAIFLTFYQIYPKKLLLLAIIFIVFISIELFMRNCSAFDLYLSKNEIKTSRTCSFSLFRYFAIESLMYPNFIIIFTPLIIVGYYTDVKLIYLFIIYFLYCLVNTVRSAIKRLVNYYKF